MPSSPSREAVGSPRSVVSSAKLFAPAPRPGDVIRHALLGRIGPDPSVKLVLLHAAAGFGKTTFMAQLRLRLQQSGLATAWLTLDAADNDSVRFLACLAEASSAMLGPQSTDTPPLDAMDRLMKADHPFALFLDDFQVLREPAVLALVRALLNGLPAQCFLVIGSRSYPDLPIARLRAVRTLIEVDTDDLRFAADEAAALFRFGLGHEVPERSLQRFVSRTEGWVTALWLASRSMAASGGWDESRIDGFTGSSRAIADYLADDVFAQQPQDVQDFLVRSSILHHLELDLCQSLTPRHDVAAILKRLEQESLFLVALPGPRPAWRYQSFFVDFLRDRLSRQGDEAARLHLLASAWYDAQGRAVPAIDHAIKAGDYPHALALLAPHAQPLLSQGRMRLLARWFNDIPHAAMQSHPELRAVSLWALLFTRGPVAASEALAALARDAESHAAVRPHFNGIRPLMFSMCDRYDEAIAAGRQSLAALPSGNAFADGVLRNAMALIFTVMRQPAEARRLIDEARSATGDTHFNRMYAESVEGLLDLQAGRLRMATARFRTAVGATRAASHNYSSGNAWAGLLYASVLYEANDLESAERLADIYLPIAADVGLPGHMCAGYMIRTRIAFSRGDIDRSFENLTELEYLAHHRQLPRIVANAKLERSKLLILQGDSRAALEELDRAADPVVAELLARQHHSANEIDYPALARARWQVHFGDIHAVLPWLAQELEQSMAEHRMRRVLRLRVLYSLALQRSGDLAAASAQMATALRQGASEGFVRLFVDEGPEVGRIVHRINAMQQQIPMNRSDVTLVDYLNVLIKAFGPLPDERHPDPQAPQSMELMEPLTRKEMQVLQLLADGHSNAAMAERLEASDSTVRTHLRSINSKLGAHSRAEAVAIARRFGILR